MIALQTHMVWIETFEPSSLRGNKEKL